jgi:RimJ/RimL family protein N-acetyltransferase
MLDRWTDQVPPLHGELTTLREVAALDVYPLFTLFSDPAVTEYMAPAPPTLAKFAGFVEWSHRQRAQGHGVCFGIVPHGMTAAVGILQVRFDPTVIGVC